jgi:hypothetical protein
MVQRGSFIVRHVKVSSGQRKASTKREQLDNQRWLFGRGAIHEAANEEPVQLRGMLRYAQASALSYTCGHFIKEQVEIVLQLAVESELAICSSRCSRVRVCAARVASFLAEFSNRRPVPNHSSYRSASTLVIGRRQTHWRCCRD